eukprot:INCI12808.3.p1 GENE.INCI12808.3~~INCI12808.3.p1  ORF type:complete len:1011 (+),score=198.42 INCI12808.3:601-3633(+)
MDCPIGSIDQAWCLIWKGSRCTVFGPDDPSVPDAWFNVSDPVSNWGLLPRLAFDLFGMQDQTWKFSLKYFQNVIDIVRDLLSPTGEERNYKQDMRKDKDGFMDIRWCVAQPISTWNELRVTFKKSNLRKSISPTQFNHQSTRGHCIMTLEVNKPVENDSSRRQKARIYVCDLAGTEPAADIKYSVYRRHVWEDGSVEHQYVGDHPDVQLTKTLQEQGKKINLSLSEMAQFFLKMAAKIKNGQLKPGESIPGCNSYFLCKYLKNTMLRARTYLFCAIRPEFKFQQYTFSTLNFGKNASVVKLKPTKAIVAATEEERKLRQELEEYKMMVESLRLKNLQLEGGASRVSTSRLTELEEQLREQREKEQQLLEREAAARKKQEELLEQLQKVKDSAGGDVEAAKRREEELQRELQAQRDAVVRTQDELNSFKTSFEASMGATDEGKVLLKLKEIDDMALTSEGATRADNPELLRQREEYERRGISLAYFDGDRRDPHLITLDRDPFRNKRLIYFLKPGPKGTIFGSDVEGDVQLFGLAVAGYHCRIYRNETVGSWQLENRNGATFHNGKELQPGDVVNLACYDRIVLGGEITLFVDPAIAAKFEEPPVDMAFEEYYGAQRPGDGQSTVDPIQREVLEIRPQIKEAKQLCEVLNRGMLTFEPRIHSRHWEESSVTTLKVLVTNTDTGESIPIDTYEFVHGLSTIKDEAKKLRIALDSGSEYTSPEAHDPIRQFMDRSIMAGVAICFPEYLAYMFDTDPQEAVMRISSPVGQTTIGKLEMIWTPAGDEKMIINDPSELIGQPWTYRVDIKRAWGLPFMCTTAYVQYEFYGDVYTTEQVEHRTHAPEFHYSAIHRIECVTQDFLDWLQQPMPVYLYASPAVLVPKDPVSTSNAAIVRHIQGSSSTQLAVSAGGGAASVDAGDAGDASQMERIAQLQAELSDEQKSAAGLERENEWLRSVLISLCNHISSSTSWTKERMAQVLKPSSTKGGAVPAGTIENVEEAPEETAMRIAAECAK